MSKSRQIRDKLKPQKSMSEMKEPMRSKDKKARIEGGMLWPENAETLWKR